MLMLGLTGRLGDCVLADCIYVTAGCSYVTFCIYVTVGCIYVIVCLYVTVCKYVADCCLMGEEVATAERGGEQARERRGGGGQTDCLILIRHNWEIAK